ncbi:MAG: PilZ domain-containing protein, partial [Cyanobacteria bacterium J06632_3]
RVRFDGQTYEGTTCNLSDTGVLVELQGSTGHLATNRPIRVELLLPGLNLQSRFVHRQDAKLSTLGLSKVGLVFDDMPLADRRRLVELIYCSQPANALNKQGGLDTLLSLLFALAQLRPILRRYRS